MNDPWTGILKALEPEYDNLVHMADKGPYIIPEIWKNSRGKWTITLQEVWDDFTITDMITSVNFEESINWASNELSKWDCFRTSYDTWVFKKKRDAEKFKTLFLIRWPN